MDIETIIELIGVASALIYTWLEFEQRSAMWLVGILSSLMYVVVTFCSGLYAYMALYGYYVGVSVYGLWQWKFARHHEHEPPPISHVRWQQIPVLTLLAGMLSVVLYFVLTKYADAPLPKTEAIGTALSIIAVWMLAKKYLEHWLVWIVADTIMAALFFAQHRYPSAGLGAFYTAAAVYGYFKWKKSLTKNKF